MPNWRSTTLGELVALQRGHDLPQGQRVVGSVPVVGSGGIAGWHNIAKVTGPGVTLGRAANLGIPTLISGDFWPLNTTLYVTDFRGNDIRFIYYLFQTLDLSGYNSGSVQPMLNRNFIKDVSVRVPAPPEQRRISLILGALDDKIAINDRIARTSRDLGSALFRSVLNESSREAPIGELTTLLTRGQAPRYTEEVTGVTVLNQKCVRDGRILLEPARRTEASRVKPDRILQKYDVLVNSTGVGTLGRAGIWPHDTVATVDSHVTILRIGPSLPAIVGGFALLAAQPEIEALGEGSTGQTELSRTKLASLRVRIPESSTKELANRLSVLEERADAALAESKVLAALRDTLLPELMSGRLRVKDAEKVSEEAV